jgi:ABC-type multidrug transport system ATPase subunit
VDLVIGAGETLLVLGPNGAGKTTLLRVLATLLRPSGGEVRVFGAALPGEAWKVRGRIGLLGHDALLYRDLSGRENLRFHARLHGLGREAAEARIAALLGAVGMERRADDRVAELSAGMRQRLAICRCVLHEPDLLLLDEPDSNLDAAGRELAQGLIGPAPGRTRVVVSHDPERFQAEADKTLRLGIDVEAVAL